MPRFTAYQALMTALETDIRAAWPQVRRIYRGWPKTEPARGEAYAVIWFDPEAPIQYEPSGQAMMLTPRLFITKIEPLPRVPEHYQDRQVADADALIARLERDIRYAEGDDGYTMQDPWGTLGRLDMVHDEQVFITQVMFSARVRECHESKR